MIYKGSCKCGLWQANMDLAKSLRDLSPRVCDCEYCQSHPSAIVSDPEMTINLIGDTPKISKNGDQLAGFYCCSQCNYLLAVGCNLKGTLRGAVNHALFGGAELFGEPIQIQPRLLQKNK